MSIVLAIAIGAMASLGQLAEQFLSILVGKIIGQHRMDYRTACNAVFQAAMKVTPGSVSDEARPLRLAYCPSGKLLNTTVRKTAPQAPAPQNIAPSS